MKKASLILVLIFSVICNVSFAHGRGGDCCAKKKQDKCYTKKAKSCGSEAASCGSKKSCDSKSACGDYAKSCCDDKWSSLAKDHAKCCNTFHDNCYHSCQYCPKDNYDGCSSAHHGCDYCYQGHRHG